MGEGSGPPRCTRKDYKIHCIYHEFMNYSCNEYLVNDKCDFFSLYWFFGTDNQFLYIETRSISRIAPNLRHYFRETPPRLKSSAIMTSFFACQKSSIKCQQFTTVKFKNVSKHNRIKPCSFYSPLIVWNQLKLFHGCTKISIFLTCGPIRWFKVVILFI